MCRPVPVVFTLNHFGTNVPIFSGWRPADLWLRSQYPEVSLSVASPNSLRGSMAIGGMAVKSWFFSRYPEAVISETHPKVLYFALTHRKYDWEESSLDMADFLSARLAVNCRPRNDNEFDGAISCYAVFEHLLATGGIISIVWMRLNVVNI